MRNRNLAGIVLFIVAAVAIAAASDKAATTQSKHSHVRIEGSVVGAGLYAGFMQQPNVGQVKLESVDKDASVYVDGAYAGSKQKLKSFWLAPGVYHPELRDDGQRSFRQRVYVLSGKELTIHPRLQPEIR